MASRPVPVCDDDRLRKMGSSLEIQTGFVSEKSADLIWDTSAQGLTKMIMYSLMVRYTHKLNTFERTRLVIKPVSITVICAFFVVFCGVHT